MAGAAKPIIHGGDHSPGGADPMRSYGASDGDTILADGAGGISWGPGGGGPKQVLAVWGGTIPVAVGTGQVWTVPNDTNGDPHTFALARAYARIEDTASGDVVIRIEKSAGGGAFSAVTVTTLTIAAGDFDTTDTTFSVSVTSGDLLRIVFVDIDDATDTVFHVELLGSE